MPPIFEDSTWESIRMISEVNLPSWLRSPRINNPDSLDSTTYLYGVYSGRDREISLRSENGEPIRMVSETSPFMRFDDFIRDEVVFVGLSNNQGEEFRVPMRELLHEEAQEYRAQGGEEDSEYFRGLQERWRECMPTGGDASVECAQAAEMLRRRLPSLRGDYHEASVSANLEFDEEGDHAAELEPSDELDKFLSELKIKG